MRSIKTFEEHLKNGAIIRIQPDFQRAKNLEVESLRKLNRLNKIILIDPLIDENANDYIEDCYNIIMFKIRAILLKTGYKASGQGAHEAEISYLQKIDFNEKDVQFCNQLRYFRNGILYYGKRFDKEYAEKVIKFLNEINKKLNKKT